MYVNQYQMSSYSEVSTIMNVMTSYVTSFVSKQVEVCTALCAVVLSLVVLSPFILLVCKPLIDVYMMFIDIVAPERRVKKETSVINTDASLPSYSTLPPPSYESVVGVGVESRVGVDAISVATPSIYDYVIDQSNTTPYKGQFTPPTSTPIPTSTHISTHTSTPTSIPTSPTHCLKQTQCHIPQYTTTRYNNCTNNVVSGTFGSGNKRPRYEQQHASFESDYYYSPSYDNYYDDRLRQ
jgi:hypothetical protein